MEMIFQIIVSFGILETKEDMLSKDPAKVPGFHIHGEVVFILYSYWSIQAICDKPGSLVLSDSNPDLSSRVVVL